MRSPGSVPSRSITVKVLTDKNKVNTLRRCPGLQHSKLLSGLAVQDLSEFRDRANEPDVGLQLGRLADHFRDFGEVRG